MTSKSNLMKNLYTTLLFFLLFASAASAQVETLLSATTRSIYSMDNLVFEPRDSVVNAYVESNGEGLLNERFEYVYDDTIDQWNEQGRWTFFYDMEENPTEDFFELLINGEYKNEKRFVYNYNMDGNVSDYTFEKWNTDTWELDYEWTLEYNADGFDTFAEQVVYVDGMAENNQQRITVYDAMNLIDTRTFTKWQNDEWQNDKKLIYSHDPDGKIIDIITEKWAADMWNLQKKDDYEHDADGNPILITTSAYQAGDWIPVSRRISEFDYDLDPDGFITSRLNQAYDFDTEMWVDQTLINFYYEEYDFTVGLTDQTISKLDFFPNPATSGAITLEVPGLENNAVLEIYSQDGKLQSLRPLQAGVNQIDLPGLSTGMYFLKVDTKENTWIGKLSIQ